jgi:hypothetical protein
MKNAAFGWVSSTFCTTIKTYQNMAVRINQVDITPLTLEQQKRVDDFLAKNPKSDLYTIADGCKLYRPSVGSYLTTNMGKFVVVNFAKTTRKPSLWSLAPTPATATADAAPRRAAPFKTAGVNADVHNQLQKLKSATLFANRYFSVMVGQIESVDPTTIDQDAIEAAKAAIVGGAKCLFALFEAMELSEDKFCFLVYHMKEANMITVTSDGDVSIPTTKVVTISEAEYLQLKDAFAKMSVTAPLSVPALSAVQAQVCDRLPAATPADDDDIEVVCDIDSRTIAAQPQKTASEITEDQTFVLNLVVHNHADGIPTTLYDIVNDLDFSEQDARGIVRRLNYMGLIKADNSTSVTKWLPM